MPNFKRLTQSACNDSALQRRFTVNLNLISALKDIQLFFTMTPRSRRQVRRNFAQIFLAAGGSLPPQRKRPNRPQLLLAASPGRIIGGGGSCALFSARASNSSTNGIAIAAARAPPSSLDRDDRRQAAPSPPFSIPCVKTRAARARCNKTPIPLVSRSTYDPRWRAGVHF